MLFEADRLARDVAAARSTVRPAKPRLPDFLR